jgi:hypothetical protein
MIDLLWQFLLKVTENYTTERYFRFEFGYGWFHILLAKLSYSYQH